MIGTKSARAVARKVPFPARRDDVRTRPEAGVLSLAMPAETPLQTAVSNLEADEVRHLLVNGADPNEVDDQQGWTLLHFAVDAEVDEAAQKCTLLSGEITCLLLDAGADRSIENREGETPLDMAARRGHFVAVRLLRSP